MRAIAATLTKSNEKTRGTGGRGAREARVPQIFPKDVDLRLAWPRFLGEALFTVD
jgi:hypothetical protein